MSCDKKSLKSKKAARKMIAMGIAGGQRMRVYFCEECKAYHTTKGRRDTFKGY